MKARLGLIPDEAARTIDDVGIDLLAAMRGQAVEDDDVARGRAHHARGHPEARERALPARRSSSCPMLAHTSVLMTSAPLQAA